MVTMNDAAAKVGAKKDMHNACVRNGFIMPTLKSKICTWRFMNEVRLGLVYVPKHDNVKRGLCPERPSEQVIRNELVRVIQAGIDNNQVPANLLQQFVCLQQHLKKHTADKDWLLDVLATVSDNHEFFSKSYRPPKRVADILDYQVPGDNGFFDDLPDARKGNTRATYNLLTREQKDAYKLMKLQ